MIKPKIKGVNEIAVIQTASFLNVNLDGFILSFTHDLHHLVVNFR